MPTISNKSIDLGEKREPSADASQGDVALVSAEQASVEVLKDEPTKSPKLTEEPPNTCEPKEIKESPLIDTRWFKSIVVVPNSGSTARDHLANERTYLAEFRFCLVVIALGMSILGKFRFEDTTEVTEVVGLDADWAGIAWVALGLLLTFFCIINYFVMQTRYVKSRAPLQNFKVVIPVIALMAITICTFTISALV
ncbi:hypothetical protein K7432_003606 [Basidiobolus ranarum]|uniref:DUF202 domain-containing protein n=1 Tax=Basidiobolus ranarum TaxID=34480 RepID=A0ABR2WZI2_9FUNG